jgi:hypothetical protein
VIAGEVEAVWAAEASVALSPGEPCVREEVMTLSPQETKEWNGLIRKAKLVPINQPEPRSRPRRHRGPCS